MKSVLGADPHILFDRKSGFYYCYCTGSDETGHFFIYRSKDLIEWEFISTALDPITNNWGKDWFWAPECYYNDNNGYYYLFYSAKVKDSLTEEYFNDPNYEETCKIGIAVSKSPEGPFINIISRPLDYYPYDPNYSDIDAVCNNVFDKREYFNNIDKAPKGAYLSSIDANLFFDKDRIFLYYSRCCYRNCIYDNYLDKVIEESNIVCVELTTAWWYEKTPVMPSIKEEYIDYDENRTRRQDKFVNIINYQEDPQEWENAHVNDYELKGERNRRWSEGSTTFITNIDGIDKYCITYSCNHYRNELYGVGIAFSDSPLGKFKKYAKNPIISQDEGKPIYSTGHGTIIEKDDGMYYFFHGREDKKGDRILYLGKIFIETLDKIYVSNIKKCYLK